jgi:hypothetical protein
MKETSSFSEISLGVEAGVTVKVNGLDILTYKVEPP